MNVSFCLIRNFFLYKLVQLSKATLPSVTITFNFFRYKISVSKKLEQLISSRLSGLSPGGTHFNILVI